MTSLPPELCDLHGRVVFFPVRHHSPTAARLVSQLIQEMRPAAVLIEGPSDYNQRLEELFLPHRLPIAIYSYLRRADGSRRGAFYPFCIYSPEWQALCAARSSGAQPRFIDLPYAHLADLEEGINRYSDKHLRASRYVDGLCRSLGVEGFNELWDRLVEQQQDLDIPTYLQRVHALCGHIRLFEDPGPLTDQSREAFMVAEIQRSLEEQSGRLVVVTGGWHSLALYRGLQGKLGEPELPPADFSERGLSLTPYAYERLDSLTGYDAGLPNPGYYDRLWHDRAAGRANTHRSVLAEVVKALRARKQEISSADLIAVESCASALALLRGHPQVWRTDLLDGILGALVKDELAGESSHPLLQAVHEVLRGTARGSLASGTLLPALVEDMQRQLGDYELQPEVCERTVELDLLVAPERARSRLLHRLRCLGVEGFQRIDGTDFSARQDMTRLWEGWRIVWTPNFEASAVEAARYGVTVAEAAAERLAERAAQLERDAEGGAQLLLEASLAQVGNPGLYLQVQRLIQQDGNFLGVSGALRHLVYLYHYDEALASKGQHDIGLLLRQALARSLWLLESLGQSGDAQTLVVRGIASLLEAFRRCHLELDFDRAEMVEVLTRVLLDAGQDPAVRGAASGALWGLGAADCEEVLVTMRRFADPQRLGDFLHGLFALAREAAQREAELVLAIDHVLASYDDDSFLAALPALRLAFTYFTPREKGHLVQTLREAHNVQEEPLLPLEVSLHEAALALAAEADLWAALQRYGLRGVHPGGSA